MAKVIFSPSVALRLMNYFATPHPAAIQSFPELTEREHEILSLIARNSSNISNRRQADAEPQNRAQLLSTIFGKLQVADRTEAVSRAPARGWADEKVAALSATPGGRCRGPRYFLGREAAVALNSARTATHNTN